MMQCASSKSAITSPSGVIVAAHAKYGEELVARDGNKDSCEKVEVFTDSDGLATNQALPQGEDIQFHLR